MSKLNFTCDFKTNIQIFLKNLTVENETGIKTLNTDAIKNKINVTVKKTEKNDWL